MSFFCKFTLKRKVLGYGDQSEHLKQFFFVFIAKTPTPYFSWGCNADFVVNKALPVHLQINFQNNALVAIAKGDVNITIHEQQERLLTSGEFLTIPFITGNLSVENLLSCHFSFADFSLKVVLQKEQSLRDIADLEQIYGPLQKIAEGSKYLVFKSNDNKVVKVLRSSKNVCIQNFLKKVNQQISNNFFLSTQNVKKEPVCHLSQEHFEGETLQNYLTRKGPLRYRKAMFIIHTLAIGIKQLHKQNHTIGLLQPKDVLYNKGQIKITDFNEDVCEDLMDLPAGQYIAPEYLREEEGSFASDVFSLGVIFYELLTGKLPCGSIEDYQEMVFAEDFLDHYKLQRSSPKITPQISELLEAMLCFEPEQRPDIGKVLFKIKNIFDFFLWEKGIIGSTKTLKTKHCLQLIPNTYQQKTKVFPLQENKTTVLGRMGQIKIPKEQMLSRYHLEIKVDTGKCTLADLKSANGTWVNGQKIDKITLESGATFRIGHTTLCFWDLEQMRTYRDQVLVGASTKKENLLLEFFDAEEEGVDKEEKNIDTFKMQTEDLQKLYQAIEANSGSKKNKISQQPLMAQKKESLFQMANLALMFLLSLSLYLLFKPAQKPAKSLPKIIHSASKTNDKIKTTIMAPKTTIKPSHQNVYSAEKIAIAVHKKLEKSLVQFLATKNVQQLNNNLDKWEDDIEKYLSLEVTLQSENFRKVLVNFNILQYKLRKFLLTQAMQNKKSLYELIYLSGAFKEWKEIRQSARQLWGSASFFVLHQKNREGQEN